MLQKGIIETIEDKYTVKVRVPKYDKLESSATGTKKEDLSVGIICTLPGMNISYAVGDIVLVDFENDELSKPVVLGLLYRDHESRSILELKGVSNSIEQLDEKLTALTGNGLYTHVKYSNDGGNTFTSLYDPSTVTENSDFTVSPQELIEIDPSVTTIYWSVVDENNFDITQQVPIITSIIGRNPVKEITIQEDHNNEYLIEAPFSLQACTEAYIDFTIRMPQSETSKYYITLTTDKNSIGTAYGDYIGVCVSNDPNPSTNAVDYTWMSTKSRTGLSINDLQQELLPRIQKNEIDLRGWTKEIVDADGNVVDSGDGLLEAINIYPQSIMLGVGRTAVIFGTSGTNFVQPSNSSLHINSVVQSEFQFVRQSKQDGKHLMLFYNEE